MCTNSSLGHHLGFVLEFIREWNDHKGMKMNGMYLSKGKEWKRMEWNGIK